MSTIKPTHTIEVHQTKNWTDKTTLATCIFKVVVTPTMIIAVERPETLSCPDFPLKSPIDTYRWRRDTGSRINGGKYWQYANLCTLTEIEEQKNWLQLQKQVIDFARSLGFEAQAAFWNDSDPYFDIENTMEEIGGDVQETFSLGIFLNKNVNAIRKYNEDKDEYELKIENT